MGRRLIGWIRESLEQGRFYFTPGLMKRIDESIEKSIEAGKERFTDSRPRVDSVETEGDKARAVVVFPPRSEKGRERRERIILAKTGDKWLVDDVQMTCWNCQATGKCGPCKGTGKFGETNCFNCKGKKTCQTCGGAGWKSLDR